MSYAAIINVEVEDVEDSTVEEVMSELGWDGAIKDVIGGTVYFEGSGNICMGTSETKQEELVRNAFDEKAGKEVEISIFWG